MPLRSSPVQDGYQVRLLAVQFRQQHVPEQVVAAVPVSPPVQRHQQQVRPLQLRQGRHRTARAEHRIAQRAAQAPQHRGPGQERAVPAGDPRQELRLQVLAHQPVVAAERHRRIRKGPALLEVERRQVQPGRPPLGPPVQLRHLILTQAEIRIAQQPGRLLPGERQVTRPDLQDLALGAQPRDRQRRLGPAGQHHPGPARHMIGQHGQRGPALGVVQRVHVVQDQRHGRDHRRESRAAAAGRPSRAPSCREKQGHRIPARRPAPPHRAPSRHS